MRLGTVRRKDVGIFHKVEKYIAHPNARKVHGKGWFNDFAILKLEKPIKMNGKSIKPVTLGTEEEFNKFVKPNSASKDMCVVIGFGRSGKGGARVWEDKVIS